MDVVITENEPEIDKDNPPPPPPPPPINEKLHTHNMYLYYHNDPHFHKIYAPYLESMKRIDETTTYILQYTGEITEDYLDKMEYKKVLYKRIQKKILPPLTSYIKRNYNYSGIEDKEIHRIFLLLYLLIMK